MDHKSNITKINDWVRNIKNCYFSTYSWSEKYYARISQMK